MKTPISALLKGKAPDVHWVPPTATVQEAVDVMVARRIGCVLVLAEGAPVGIFSERDVLTRVVGRGLDPRATAVSAVMTTALCTISLDTPLDAAMALISTKRVRHLPVLEGGRLAGLVSIGDVNKWVVDHLQFEAETLRSYVSGGYPG